MLRGFPYIFFILQIFVLKRDFAGHLYGFCVRSALFSLIKHVNFLLHHNQAISGQSLMYSLSNFIDCNGFRSSVLNEDQMIAVRHIVVQREGYTPPFIMYGPFGTGKTETLAQATMTLLRERRESCRILICTQSNR